MLGSRRHSSTRESHVPVSEVTALGWFHTAACSIALVFGALQLFGKKQTAAHPLRGKIYFWSMSIAMTTTLFLYSTDVVIRPGEKPLIGPHFGVFHWVAVFTLLLVVLGQLSAGRQRMAFFAYAHPVFMILSYWLLVGAGITAAFTRIDGLRELALSISPGAKTLVQLKLVIYVAFATPVVHLGALVAAIVSVRRMRRRTSRVLSGA
jgi:uncharacterized membrane protein